MVTELLHRLARVVSTKVLVQAVAAAAVVVGTALTSDTSVWEPLPDYAEGLVVVGLPAVVAWLTKERNPAPSAIETARLRAIPERLR